MVTMMDAVVEWHRHQIGMPVSDKQLRLLAGFPLFGEKYAVWFAYYGLPSILAPENRRALEEAGGKFVLYVDGAARWILEPHLKTDLVDLRPLPEVFAAAALETPQLKYPLMTAVHSILINEAAQRGAGFSMSVGDLVYSDRYLARLLDLGARHDAVVHVGLQADRTYTQKLAKWRHGDVLAVPATALGAYGYSHMTKAWRSWSMEDTKDYTSLPASHLIFWRGKDHLRIHCPHMGPVWLGNERCRAAGVIPVINGGIDAEQPRFMGSNFYMPQLVDDMALITLNDAQPACDRLSFDAFRQNLFGLLGPSREWLPYFKAPCVMPADKTAGPWQTDETIEAEWQELQKRLGIDDERSDQGVAQAPAGDGAHVG